MSANPAPAAAPARPAPPRPKPKLPEGLRWSNVWRAADGGAFVEHGREIPIDRDWRPAGELWLCPVKGCDQEGWTFTPPPEAPCCRRHPAQMIPVAPDANDRDPVAGARARLTKKINEIVARKRQAAVDAATARLNAAQAAVAEAAQRTAADMRGHVPSLAASAVIAGAEIGLAAADPMLAELVGLVVATFGAVLAYIAVYALQRWRAHRDGVDLIGRARRRARSRAYHVAVAALAAGVWGVLVGLLGADPATITGDATLLLGSVLAWAVNRRHWETLWETRRRLRELARLKAEEAARRAQEELDRASRPGPEATPPATAEDGPLEMGRRMAAIWTRIAESDTVPAGFLMRRTRIVPPETREVTVPDGDDVMRIGWEYAIESEPGVLVARMGGTPPLLLAREWLAAMLGLDQSWVALVDRPDGKANRGLLLITDGAPLGGTVPWKGPAGIRRGADGSLYGHVGRTMKGEDVEKALWIPGQPGGGGRYGHTGGGKALALDTPVPVPTPNGWTTMGALSAGDLVFDETGQVCRVTDAWPVMTGRPCYEVEFSDGSTIVADAGHLWRTSTNAGRIHTRAGFSGSTTMSAATLGGLQSAMRSEPDQLVTASDLLQLTGGQLREVIHAMANATPVAGHVRRGTNHTRAYAAGVICRSLLAYAGTPRNADRITPADVEPVTTEQIAATVRLADGRATHAIDVCGPLDYPARELPFPPYALGQWLGDYLADEGVIAVPTANPLTYGLRLVSTSRHGAAGRAFRAAGVLNNKHIPRAYLQASIEQRRALLAGLLDSDGYCNPVGGVRFTSTNSQLADDVLELAIGLGFKATMTTKSCNGRTAASSTVYTVSFTPDVPVFRLSRKLARQRPARPTSTARRRYIVAVRPVPSVPVRCVAVDSPNHLFLVGRACIPTHNSVGTRLTLLNDLAAGIFTTLYDPKNFVDFSEFIGVIPMGCTPEHRDIILRSLWAEMQRRQRTLTQMVGTDRHGRTRPVEGAWKVQRDGPPIRSVWEEFHMESKDQAYIAALTALVRLQRATASMVEAATQGGGLADVGDSVLRGLLNLTCMEIYRMPDSQARLAGYSGTYPPSQLPPIPGVLLMVAGAGTPAVPMRTAFVTREDVDGCVYDYLYAPDGSPLLTAPSLPKETMEVFRREGLIDLWNLGKGPNGLANLLGGTPAAPPPGALASASGDANQRPVDLPAADVVLAIALTNPGCPRATLDNHPVWQTAPGWGQAPAPSTISRAATRLGKEGLITRDDNAYRVTDKGHTRAAAAAQTLFGTAPSPEPAAGAGEDRLAGCVLSALANPEGPMTVDDVHRVLLDRGWIDASVPRHTVVAKLEELRDMGWVARAGDRYEVAEATLAHLAEQIDAKVRQASGGHSIGSYVMSVLTGTVTGDAMSVEDVCAAIVANGWAATPDEVRPAVVAKLLELREHGLVTPDGERLALSQAAIEQLTESSGEDHDDQAE